MDAYDAPGDENPYGTLDATYLANEMVFVQTKMQILKGLISEANFRQTDLLHRHADLCKIAERITEEHRECSMLTRNVFEYAKKAAEGNLQLRGGPCGKAVLAGVDKAWSGEDATWAAEKSAKVVRKLNLGEAAAGSARAQTPEPQEYTDVTAPWAPKKNRHAHGM